MSRERFESDPYRDDDSLRRENRTRKGSRRTFVDEAKELAEGIRFDLPTDEPLGPDREETPRAYSLGDRTFLLRESETKTISELGVFRLVAAADLGRFVYSGDTVRMERHIRRLKKLELVVERTLPTSGRKSLRVVGLTKKGNRLLQEANLLPKDQVLYHGIVKVREAKHDAELYRLFRAEAARIESAGGRPLRVILDYELRRDLNRERARLGERAKEPEQIERLAKRHRLAVVNGKIPLPDLRIEYQTSEFELRYFDLELATRHYRPCGVAEKAKAGFALYSSREDAPRLHRILDKQELTRRIFVL